MRITEEEKAKNRARIVETAGKLFRERGLENVGIADLMREAGFTHGGFYNHFESKEALAAEVCASSTACANKTFAEQLSGPDADDAWRAYIDAYLSPAHRDGPATGCTLSALMGDFAHEDKDVQASVVQASDEYLGIVGRYFTKRYRLDAAAARRRAIEAYTQMLGAISLSRAMVQADRALADEVLEACREKLSR